MTMYRGSPVGTVGAAISALTRRVSAIGVVTVGLGMVGLTGSVLAQGELEQEALAAQQAQAELQKQIDAADESVRIRIEQLRQAEHNARRLSGYNDALEPQTEELEATLAEQEAGVSTLSETREALPALLIDMTRRLDDWIEQDIPFLKDERLARVAMLNHQLANSRLSTSEKLEQVLAVWRAELDYGRELGAWRGKLLTSDAAAETAADTLPQDMPQELASAMDDLSGAMAKLNTREVDYLRLGRVGWYYLTPDGQQGAVWKAADQQWQPLTADQRKEVARGLSIVRDQRAPELLNLPLSQPRPQPQSRHQENRS